MTPAERVQKMEGIMNRLSALYEKVAAVQQEYEDSFKEFQELEKYYYSDWSKDLEADKKGEIGGDFPRGVLSEDAVYDLMGENRNIAIAQIKHAIKVIE